MGLGNNQGFNKRFQDERTGRFKKASQGQKNKFFRTDTLTQGIANFAFKTSNAMGEIAVDFANDLLDYAVKNAPWEDRTGDARAGLATTVVVRNESLEVDLFHTIDYGIWLEVRWGGKYAIIIPTVETLGPRLLEKMNGILSEIYYP